ncbi:MAG: hypothetical protein KDK91_31200 [Gammaproteobacteria bacterium]|nr:hypothetical protein [Gammaproteobacteria bacterium]
MRYLSRISVLASVTVMVLASAAGASEGYVTNYEEIVKAADWSNMKTVVVELDEHSYSHDGLHFKVGQSYRLRLRNVGEQKHYFTAPEFFRSIATRKVQSDKDGEIKAPYFTALEMMANGGTLDLYFVPVRTGRYPVRCTIDDHERQGMHDTITIAD